jgi:hypothetical protein
MAALILVLLLALILGGAGFAFRTCADALESWISCTHIPPAREHAKGRLGSRSKRPGLGGGFAVD